MEYLVLAPIGNKTSGQHENVIVKDETGYPFGLIFIDAFHGKDSDIHERIKLGKQFRVKVILDE